MRRTLLLVAILSSLLAVACAGGGADRIKPDVQKPDLQKPERTVERADRTVERPEITPLAVEPNLTPAQNVRRTRA